MWRATKPILVIMAAVLIMASWPAAARSEAGLAAGSLPPYTLRSRFGIGISSLWGRTVNDYPIGTKLLNAGWYTDWTWQIHPSRPNGMEYVQTIPVNVYFTDWERLRQAVLANPGSTWVIGNEPETWGQNTCTPWDYALRYHDLYTHIKGVDPTALIAIAGVVQATPLRLRWLDDVIKEYQALFGMMIPVDVWNLHEQILREDFYGWGCGVPLNAENKPLYCRKDGQIVYCQPSDPSSVWVTTGEMYLVTDNANLNLFRQHIVRFRQWMKDHGQQDKPLIITEYGVMMPRDYISDNDLINYMKGTFQYMLDTRDVALGYAADDYRLVQRWAWFSLNTWPDPFSAPPGSSFYGYNGNLCEWDRDVMTVFGHAYKEATQEKISLIAGWNLIGLQGPPVSTVATDVLSSIATKYDLVYAYNAADVADPWKIYDIARPPFLNDLTAINETTGFWIRATAACDLLIYGHPSGPVDIPLKAGWNLVSYPSETARLVTEALASIAGKYDLIYAYDAADVADPWKIYDVARPPFLNDLVTMTPKRGYWIRVSEECTWRVQP